MKEEGKDLPGGPGVRTPDWGTKIPHALRCGQFFFFFKERGEGISKPKIWLYNKYDNTIKSRSLQMKTQWWVQQNSNKNRPFISKNRRLAWTWKDSVSIDQSQEYAEVYEKHYFKEFDSGWRAAKEDGHWKKRKKRVLLYLIVGLPQWLSSKDSPCNAGDAGD